LTLGVRRQKDAAEQPPVARYGDLILRYDSHRAGWKGEGVDLTLTEFEILAHLVENADRDLSYRELYDIVHGEGFVAGEGDAGYRTNVRAFIKRIRQKFHEIDADFALIRNYPGFGYRWCDEREQ
jgi:two-component system response regulator ChvI